MRWQDIDDDTLTVRQSVITVKGAQPHISTPKTKKGVRRIALGEDTVAVLEAHRVKQEVERAYLGEAWLNTGLVFTNELGGVLSPRNFDRVWYGLQERVEVPRVRFHDLRHFHASLLINAGLDPRTVADRIGHANPSTTLDIYSHMFEAKRRATAVNLEDMLGDEKDSDEDPDEES